MEMITGSSASSADPASIAAQRAEWDARMADYDRKWDRFRERRSAVFPHPKAAIFDALEAAGIAHVTIEFEGSGDSGQMEQATGCTAANEPVGIPDVVIEITRVDFDEDKDSSADVALREAIETVAYELLEQTHGGWEDNDGGFGTFAFDVAERSITLDFNERYTETNNSVHEF